jgi:hypothetical protein
MASDVAAAFPPPLVALNMRGGHERVRRQKQARGLGRKAGTRGQAATRRRAEGAKCSAASFR